MVNFSSIRMIIFLELLGHVNAMCLPHDHTCNVREQWLATAIIHINCQLWMLLASFNFLLEIATTTTMVLIASAQILMDLIKMKEDCRSVPLS